MTLLDRLNLVHPIIQAPMAGTSTPAMAAAVCKAGGLGSIGVAAVDASVAARMIGQIRALTEAPFNVNLFVHAPATADAAREAAWIAALTPLFHAYGAQPPATLCAIYRSFAEDDAMLAMLLETRPAVVSLHFGLPSPDRIAALKGAGCILLSTATSLAGHRRQRPQGSTRWSRRAGKRAGIAGCSIRLRPTSGSARWR